MKYIKKIRYSILRLYNNIKYILTHDLVDIDMLDVVDDRVHYLEDKMSTLLNDVDNIESTLEDKCSEYEVEDVIYNLMGNSEDYVSYDDLNDVKDDIKGINDKLTTIDNVDEGDCNNISLVTIKNIDNLLQEVNTLHSLFNDLTQEFAKSSKHSCNNLFSYSLKEWDLLVSDIIKSIISRVEYNDNV